MRRSTHLVINAISKYFETGQVALDQISLEVSGGDRLAIVGETGSGKSTLLKIIGGLLQPDSGEVIYQNKIVQGPNDRLIPGHEKIAYLSQHFELPRFISVKEHLTDEYLITEEEAQKIYDACRVTHLLDKDTRALSGGEKQRIALAKILLCKPELILLDEPFSNLDFIHKRQIKQVIEDVEEHLDIIIVLVAHEPKDVLSWADRIVVLKSGKVIQEASPKGTYKNPVDLYVAGLFGDYNLLDPDEWGLERGFQTFDGKVLVRPEYIFENKSNGIEGTIAQVNFCGAEDQLIIETKSGNIIMNSRIGKYHVNQRIRLQIKG